ncbi:MAG TPA: hypothetical protein VLV17_07235 [Anaeromyxobacteraceae bacterium]|nr:hypothetical protein [Anaeromyxobacteraceae bacterium]
MSRSVYPALLVVFLAQLSACGGIDTPDLGQGQVQGRLIGAFQQGSAYAYVLGAPATQALIASDGSYTIENAPVGPGQVVLYDGAARAGTVSVQVRPAARVVLADVDVKHLAVARTIYAAVSCSGGSSGANARYDVEGAALAAPATGEVATLFPLPPGLFTVQASLAGFSGSPIAVDLTERTSAQVEFGLGVDEGDGDHRGCLSNSCSAGLFCASDGRCYACTSDAQCGAGAECLDHLCAASTPRPSCGPCASSSDCSPGPSGQAAMCVMSPPDVEVCSYACTSSSDCPAGFSCQGQGSTSACVAAGGCSALNQAFLSPCFTDQDCAASLLQCFPSGSQASAIGFCSAPCTSDADCPAELGYRCNTATDLCGRPSQD